MPKSNLQLFVEGRLKKYAGRHLPRQDLFDLVEHDIRHLGLPSREYDKAINYLEFLTRAV